ncbi:hypothetical protein Taro_041237 [Colocasia esculenta]|uniref:Uncharacterized protein n=1 Tax=Colocasia esculenta TaxID=4460 RepID=A0A843WDU6_COLES|nr:hypothetical protein [Colocasia esculenta]
MVRVMVKVPEELVVGVTEEEGVVAAEEARVVEMEAGVGQDTALAAGQAMALVEPEGMDVVEVVGEVAARAVVVETAAVLDTGLGPVPATDQVVGMELTAAEVVAAVGVVVAGVEAAVTGRAPDMGLALGVEAAVVVADTPNSNIAVPAPDDPDGSSYLHQTSPGK